jgi:RNA polymerase sigma-70 factor (ECF subfamily)
VNDEERFTAIFETHYGRVSAYVRRRVPPSVAPDIVAETFLAAWRHLDQLGDHSLAWLYRAAAHEIAHGHRQAKRDEQLWQRAARAPWSWDEDDPAESVVRRDRWAAAFGSLSESDREVLRLSAWENLPPHEAAAVLGCTAVALRVRLHRARRRLAALATESPPFNLCPVPSVLERKDQP